MLPDEAGWWRSRWMRSTRTISGRLWTMTVLQYVRGSTVARCCRPRSGCRRRHGHRSTCTTLRRRWTPSSRLSREPAPSLQRRSPPLSLDDLYKEVILDHYQHPRNRGQLADPDVATRGHNPLCGDEVLLAVKMDGDVIQEIAFGGRGCSISQASASMMTESVKGHDVEDAS